MLTLKDRENIKTVKMINRLLKQLRKESVRLSISIDNRSAIKTRLMKVRNDIIDKYRGGCCKPYSLMTRGDYAYDRRCNKVLNLMGELEF